MAWDLRRKLPSKGVHPPVRLDLAWPRKRLHLADLSRDKASMRFWRKVDLKRWPRGCLRWTGAKTRNGWGVVHSPETGRLRYVHERVWELIQGPIPPGFYVRHTCCDPLCVQPAHLFLVRSGVRPRGPGQIIRTRPPAVRRGEQHPRARLTEAQVLEIRRIYGEEDSYHGESGADERGVTQADLAARYGVSVGCVSDIIHRRNWQHLEGGE